MTKRTVTAPAVNDVVTDETVTAPAVGLPKYIKTISNVISLKGIEIKENSFDLPELNEKQTIALKNALASGIIKEA